MWYVLGSKHTLTLLYILWGQIQPLYYMVFSERSCCRTIRRFATLAPYNIQPHRISHDIDSSGCGYSSCRVHCCSNSAALTKRRETAEFYTENTTRKGQRDGYVQCIDISVNAALSKPGFACGPHAKPGFDNTAFDL